MSAFGAIGDVSPHSQGWQLVLAIFGSMDDLPKLTTATFVGIMIAITGNVLISLALNLQKLAHKRVEAEIRARRHGGQKRTTNGNGSTEEPQHRRSDGPSLDENDEDRMYTPVQPSSTQSSPGSVRATEVIPFPHSPSTTTDYGTISPSIGGRPLQGPPPQTTTSRNPAFVSRLVPTWFRKKRPEALAATPLQASVMPVDIMSEETALRGQRIGQKTAQKQDMVEEGNEAEYLKSKLWWLGFLLMNIGEMGNFISYAWAPASVVAPLGTFALIANCMFAPLLLKERFRKRDLLGILIAIIGAVTVVLASNASNTRLDPDALLRAISQTAFIVYSCVYLIGAIVLATLSYNEIGRQWVFVDVGLCALFGGFTVLSTKAISTLLTMGVIMFSSWITYPVLAILIITGVGQIRYLNRALMRFDGKVVIPVQFVLFTLSAIIGSAILYGDFKKAKFHQIITFLYGCATTFLGVFIISWTPNTEQEDDAEDVDEELDPADGRSPVSNEESRQGYGTIGKRRRATLIMPSGARDTPILRSQHSAVSLIGLSPAQHLLLVHTPPRELAIHSQKPNMPDRRRTMSWLGDSRREGVSPGGTREDSLAERLRHSSSTRVGSLDNSTSR